MKQIVTALLIVLIGGIIAWDWSKGSESAIFSERPEPSRDRGEYVPAKPKLPGCAVLLGKSGEVGEHSTVVIGTIRNDCGRTLRYIQVTFKTYDSSGAVVGTAMANQANLGAGEVWKFEAHSFSKGTKYALDEITAY